MYLLERATNKKTGAPHSFPRVNRLSDASSSTKARGSLTSTDAGPRPEKLLRSPGGRGTKPGKGLFAARSSSPFCAAASRSKWRLPASVLRAPIKSPTRPSSFASAGFFFFVGASPPPSNNFPRPCKAEHSSSCASTGGDGAATNCCEDEVTPSFRFGGGGGASPNFFCSVAYVVDVPGNLSAGPTALYPAASNVVRSDTRGVGTSTLQAAQPCARAALSAVFKAAEPASPDVFEEARQSKTASRLPLSRPPTKRVRTHANKASSEIASTTSHETAGSLKSDSTSFVVMSVVPSLNPPLPKSAA